jgi:hypothetical protein
MIESRRSVAAPDLTTLFIVTAIIEALYAAAGLLTPPALVEPLFGWEMSPDGHWALKLLGLALGVQAATAWVLRRTPPVAVAWCLAAYQIGASLVDIALWSMLADAGIFAAAMARAMILIAIPLHFVIGVLLLLAASRRPA